jgi:hypothetical protein
MNVTVSSRRATGDPLPVPGVWFGPILFNGDRKVQVIA